MAHNSESSNNGHYNSPQAASFNNNLSRQAAKGKLCTASSLLLSPFFVTSVMSLGVRLISGVEIVEIACKAGFDSLFIDLEHSTLSLEATGQICRASKMAGISAFIRVPAECGDGYVQRALGSGGDGIIVPHVQTVEDVRTAIAMAKYPPLGSRSITPHLLISRSAKSPLRAAEVLKEHEVILMVMIETVEALSNIDAIAAEPGLDVLQIGSMDMSMSLGILGQWDDPLYQDVLITVSRAAKKHGKLWGISGLPSRADIWNYAAVELGASFIVSSYDVNLLNQAAAANYKLIREAGGGAS
ncbi:hypothetical protein M430DRAFT_21628 [Amorphotheca resinae ATCC 22711]|uniref:HpcH/HpaI aldolase/citrate lyase domain-containing protein n=1 Tax=Amorphotheca resinae ATCC 22711 TaxID=857342 RepID=A0A2T3AV54_AMORE|nr:hypothetical protein M430DRAFT_21628 [Amorphotheca resinae ATCC 22711]PSS12551.1 hypothetical protein M430DRAFT_21628 [Amorphotheca resinae ATCC 22711]